MSGKNTWWQNKMLPIVTNQAVHRRPPTLLKPNILFCTDLRTCGLIVGYLELVSGVAALLIANLLYARKFQIKEFFFFETRVYY